MSFSDKAKYLFEEKGYNCAQAVAGAFAEEIGLTEEKAIQMSSAFGGGFGRMREVCGAACGMTMVFGALFSDKFDKATLYRYEQELLTSFAEANGSYICREILKDKAQVGGAPSERNEKFYHERPCTKCVMSACDILSDFIEKRKVDCK